MGKCFFWYRPIRVVPDQRLLNGCVCVRVRVCVCVVKYEGNFYVAAHTCTVSGVLLMNWSWETDVFRLR